MTDSALTLASLRAGRVRALGESERRAAEVAATRLGRRLIEVEPGSENTLVLGFADGYEPNPDEQLLSVHRLSPIPLIALAACLGLSWRERDQPPHRGELVEVDRVLDATGALGADRAHVLGALRHELQLAGLVDTRQRFVRPGPAIAAWSDAQVDALRRFADALPGADD